MAKTNFSGPITTGPIQNTTGSTIGENVRDAAFVTNTASFPFDYASFAATTDADRLALVASNPSSNNFCYIGRYYSKMFQALRLWVVLKWHL